VKITALELLQQAKAQLDADGATIEHMRNRQINHTFIETLEIALLDLEPFSRLKGKMITMGAYPTKQYWGTTASACSLGVGSELSACGGEPQNRTFSPRRTIHSPAMAV
jgi:hypothetical protein